RKGLGRSRPVAGSPRCLGEGAPGVHPPRDRHRGGPGDARAEHLRPSRKTAGGLARARRGSRAFSLVGPGARRERRAQPAGAAAASSTGAMTEPGVAAGRLETSAENLGLLIGLLRLL